jgi:hypothetical protein
LRHLFTTIFMFGIAVSSWAGTITYGGELIANQGLFSSEPGAFHVTFNDGFLPVTGPVTYWGASIREGTTWDVSSSPQQNTSRYLSVSPELGTPAVILFAAPIDYFGFHGSSLDPYNRIEFWNGSTLVAAYSGADFGPLFYDNYINWYGAPGETVTRIILSSPIPAFETDNHAYRFASDVATPEPATWILIGSALAVAGLRRRKRQPTKP